MARKHDLEIGGQIGVDVARDDRARHTAVVRHVLIAELTRRRELGADPIPHRGIECEGLVRAALDRIDRREIDDVVLDPFSSVLTKSKI